MIYDYEPIMVLFSVIFYVALLVFAFYKIISHFDSSSTSETEISDDTNTKEPTVYVPKRFLTNFEYDFLNKMLDLENELHVNIVPQVNLATVIDKIDNSRYHNELFRNIDFGIFNSDYSKLLLLIELNDSSHNDYNRRKRDIKVKEICQKANIKLITFYSKYPNEKGYVKQRIIKEISTLNN